MEFKSLSTDIKDLDEAKGVVVAYAAVYGNKDADGDISAPGSLTKTVRDHFKRIRVLKDHNPTIMLGVPLEIDTNDNYGLGTKSQFNMKKPVAQDMFTDILLMKENGLNAELSIGFGKTERDPKNKSIIKEYKFLGEYSFLSAWAANELATVQDIKSIKTHYGVMELLTKAYNLPYSDNRLKQIELILKSLSSEPVEPVATPQAKPVLTALKNANLILDLKSVLTS